MRSWHLAATIGALLGTASLSAHHSFGTYYFEDQSISVEGKIVEFDYRNPHAWVHIAATDLSGTTRKVSAEWASPGRLLLANVTKETLKPGDHVILTGSPSRNESEYRMHLKKIQRPSDGWGWTGRVER